MKCFSCAACDFGASSGRVIRGMFNGGVLSISEARRFKNYPVMFQGNCYWNFWRLFKNMSDGIDACNGNCRISSVGIDTWGVDFGLLDKNGELLLNPMSYRDMGNEQAMRDVGEIIDAEKIYFETGIANMPLNTIYQLYKLKQSGVLKNAEELLMLPDLFGYFLTGEKSNEITAVSTAQLMKDNDWHRDFIQLLNLPEKIFSAKLVDSGSFKGNIVDREALNGTQVISVPGHDTACAVAALPDVDENSVLISSGTWSLIGTIVKEQVISLRGMNDGYSNYRDMSGNYMLIKDIMGMWLINRCKEQWNVDDRELDFNEIVKEAEQAEAFRALINPNLDIFFSATDMMKAITENCFGKKPRSVGEVARCIFESLALEYCYSIERLEKITNRNFDCIRMMGGGIQNKFLCQCVASASNKVCICGPVEATSIGNILAQLIAAGEVAVGQIGDIVKMSFPLKEYVPQNRSLWEDAYENYKKHFKHCELTSKTEKNR